MNDIDKLTRTNRIVFKKFRKANIVQQENMIKILREQLENLKLLFSMMEEYNGKSK